jgi:hypothetical protein
MLALVFFLGACSADETLVESSVSSTSIDAVTVAPSALLAPSGSLCGDPPEAPGWPVGSVQGLAFSSDLVGWASSVKDLGEVDLSRPLRLVTIVLNKVLRGDASVKSVAVIADVFGPQLVSVGSSIVFLSEVSDPAVAAAAGVDGPIYALTPGINSILDVAGDVATSRCGEFYGLFMSDRAHAGTVVDPVTSKSLVASTDEAGDSYPVDVVVRIVADPALGPKPDQPGPSRP